MPCFLLIKLFISFFIIIVYYEVVMVLVATSAPVHSKVVFEYGAFKLPPAAYAEDVFPPLPKFALVAGIDG
jgi:hypothetical protein